MKKTSYLTQLGCIFFFLTTMIYAQGGDPTCTLTFTYNSTNISPANTISVNYTAQTVRIYLNYLDGSSPSIECREPLVYTNVPSWATITPSGFVYIDVALTENIAPENRITSFQYSINGGTGNYGQTYNGTIIITQGPGNGAYYYIDTDGDGFGDHNSDAILSLNSVTGRVSNNDDNCIEDASSTNNGCPEPYENINWTRSQSYDINGTLIASSKAYFDDLGKPTQSQTYDTKEKRVWATHTLYDNAGRPAFQTLSAPITIKNATENFQYNSNFIKKAGGINFSTTDFESGDIYAPDTIAPIANTLGWYYSNSNTDEPYQDKTNRPYSRNIYSTLNPGAVKQTIGGNKINNEWKQGYSFSMPAAQEMYYAFGYDSFERKPSIALTYTGIESVINDTNKHIVWLKATKSVVKDVHGNESVVFTDADGKTLGAARSGTPDDPNTEKQYEVLSLIGSQKYVDIHIPKGCGSTLSFIGATTNYKVYDLKTETLNPTTPTTLGEGFYRIEYIGNTVLTDKHQLTYIDKTSTSDTNKIQPVMADAAGVRYKVNYYDFSLNYYDKANRLTASLQPLGFNNSHLPYLNATVTHDQNLKSTFTYSSLGQLMSSTSPDEGTANFKYRKDGQIRFSQNSKQLDPNNDGNTTDQEFSYTDYDALGRPIESGVATGTFDANLNPDILAFSSSNKNEQHFTQYDSLNSSDLDSLSTVHTSYSNPTFLAGNVAKTYNTDDNDLILSVSYYSYDLYGRVQWIVQKIEGLGYKTIDYEYDPITSQVNKVIFQKNNASEYFEHKYTYDNASNALIKVESNTNSTTPAYTIHAEYSYYETGAIKRIELAEGIQGIDYVYNLAGQLKAINHPNLTGGKDPGNDTDDLFGMTLDYYTGDYTRNTPQSFSLLSSGSDQFNGNIKGMSWNTNAGNYVNNQNPLQYSYSYNKSNWLTDAVFNGGGTVQNSIPTDLNLATTLSNTQIKTASNSITLKPGFEFAASGAITFSATIDATASNGAYGNDDYKVYGITYDANGNIKKLNRNKNTENGNFRMDELTYGYKNSNKSNKLDYVADAVTITTNANDIKTQNPNNYIYNSIGQLIENDAENVKYEYNASGLVTKVSYNNVVRVAFLYNDKNFRTRKISYKTDGSEESTTHYVRDVAGSVLAIYVNTVQQELPIYGASRLGVYNKTSSTSVYQLADHLGNVRAVIAKNGSQAVAMTTTDYYPFGMPMPNRQIVGGQPYRYGYQGEFAETDPETGKPAFQLRLYDTRLGRWISPDPMKQYHSPYMAMDNRPNMSVDPTGGCTVGVDCPPEFDWMGKGTWVANELNLSGGSGVPWGSASITGGGVIDFSTNNVSIWDNIFSGTRGLNYPSFSQTGYIDPTSTSNIKISPNATFIAGEGLSLLEQELYSPRLNRWRGINGRVYDFDFNGNGSTGGRRSFGQASSRLVGRFGTALGAYGIYDTDSQWRQGEITTARMAQDQFFNGIGFFPGLGTAASAGYGLGGMIESWCNCNIQVNWKNVRNQKWGKVFQDPNSIKRFEFSDEFLNTK
jgi:RHS repeat-associated protein